MILANTDVIAWQDNRAALTNDDLAGQSLLAMIKFDPEILWIGIATVFA
jgi:hypothetical protein